MPRCDLVGDCKVNKGRVVWDSGVDGEFWNCGGGREDWDWFRIGLLLF